MFVLSFLLKHLDHYRPRFIAVLCVAVLNGFVSFFSPILLAEFTRGSLTFPQFRKLVILLIIVYAVLLVLEACVRRWGELLGMQIGHHLRLKFFRLFEQMSVPRLLRHHSGYNLTLVNQMAWNMQPVVISIFWTYANSIGPIILFFIFTARESLLIAAWNLFILVGFSVISVYLSKKMVELSGEINIRQASLMATYADFLANIVTVKKLGVYAFAQRRLAAKTNRTYTVMTHRQTFHAWRWFVLDGLFGAAFLSTMAFLLYRVLNGVMPVSVLILFVAGYNRINSIVERISENLRLLMEEANYIRRVQDTIGEPIPANEGAVNPRWQQITFRNVRFRYPEHNRIIRIPEFHIRRGEKVLITGTSGEGKTTLLNLCANFLEPGSGERRVDAFPYSALSREFFQQRMVMISQEVELFDLTLRENITLGRPVSTAILEKALNELDLLQWMRRLQKKLDTIVGEKGVKLSAGQKQRVNLLRGILLNREVYLLDEPTSHLDSATEQRAIAFLADHLGDKTAIIVSHKESLRALCGRTYVMRGHTLTVER